MASRLEDDRVQFDLVGFVVFDADEPIVLGPENRKR